MKKLEVEVEPGMLDGQECSRFVGEGKIKKIKVLVLFKKRLICELK